MIHWAKATSLQGCHESQPVSSSYSISQQQNCWFSHHPSEQYPILMSDSHSVAIEMTAALTPIAIPAVLRAPYQRCFRLSRKAGARVLQCVEEGRGRRRSATLTDQADDKPTLPSMRQALQLRPYPSKANFSAWSSVRGAAVPSSSQPPIALDYGVLYPIYAPTVNSLNCPAHDP